MNKLLEHGLNYLLFALKGIATAFLIVPFNTHAGVVVEQNNLYVSTTTSFQNVYLSLGDGGYTAPTEDKDRHKNTHVVEINGRGSQRGSGDTDGDGIPDYARHESDVCVEEAFQGRYHADCLTEAGLELPSASSWNCAAMNELRDQYQLDLSTITGMQFAIETITFQQAAIKTCRDLEDHKRNMRDKRNNYRWAAIGTSLGGGLVTVIVGALSGGVGGVVVAVIVTLVVAVLWSLSNEYGQYKISAENAEYELCRFR